MREQPSPVPGANEVVGGKFSNDVLFDWATIVKVLFAKCEFLLTFMSDAMEGFTDDA